MTPERKHRLESVLNARQPDLTVIADEVHKGRNMAAIVRTCDAVGVARLYSVVPEDGYNPYRGTALGANKWVDVKRCRNVLDPIRHLKEQGYQIVSTGLDTTAKHYREIDYTKPTALLMGNEKRGISEAARELTDHLVTIPMAGMVESLNVSVAAAIILNEAQNQRRDKGMYDSPFLESSEYTRLFFRWGHPKVAAFCEERGLAYPPLREDGEIIEPAKWYEAVREGVAPTATHPTDEFRP